MTTQVAEHICYEGIELRLLGEPALPLTDLRVIERSDVQTAQSCRVAFSTACWRNYVGAWSVRQGRLFLDGIAGRYRLADDAPMEATWYSGTLRMAVGVVMQVQGGHGSRYEHEFFAQIVNGQVISTWNEYNQPAGWQADAIEDDE